MDYYCQISILLFTNDKSKYTNLLSKLIIIMNKTNASSPYLPEITRALIVSVTFLSINQTLSS